MTVRFQTADNGEQFAIMSRAEYETMRDAVDHASALAEYRSGNAPGLTPDEMRRMLASPSALAFWRNYRGKTQVALATEVGIKQNYLSDLENGKREGGVSLWLKLSESLALPVNAIYEAAD